jgi:large subunit ribosomal protein L17
MRHGKKFNHLGRKTAHRKAMLSNMACSLIEHKRIKTTVAKAKALRKFIEPLITKCKDDTTHSRRIVFSYLGQKDSITELFGNIASKVSSRDGGYTRILRTHNRLGDNAEMCIIELVDYNEAYVTADKPKQKKKSTRRSGAKTAVSVVEEAQVVETEVSTEGSADVAVENTATEVSDDSDDSKASEEGK